MMAVQTWQGLGLDVNPLSNSRLKWPFTVIVLHINSILQLCQLVRFRLSRISNHALGRWLDFQVLSKTAAPLRQDTGCSDSCNSCKKLKGTCRTHWIQCIDSYTVFLELLPAVHTALQAISC